MRKSKHDLELMFNIFFIMNTPTVLGKTEELNITAEKTSLSIEAFLEETYRKAQEIWDKLVAPAFHACNEFIQRYNQIIDTIEGTPNEIQKKEMQSLFEKIKKVLEDLMSKIKNLDKDNKLMQVFFIKFLIHKFQNRFPESKFKHTLTFFSSENKDRHKIVYLSLTMLDQKYEMLEIANEKTNICIILAALKKDLQNKKLQHITLTIAGGDLAEDRIFIPRDIPQITEGVFEELCKNALDAMPEGGLLAISYIFDKENQKVRIRIRDTGKGMTEEQLKHCTQMGVSSKGEGRGSGLAMIKQYIEQVLGGEFNIESYGLEKGTIVTLILPAIAA